MRLIAVMAAFLLAGCATLGMGGQEAAGKALHALMAETWDRIVVNDPYFATQLGVPGHDHRHADLSPEGIAKMQAWQRETKTKLDAIPRDALSDEDRINYDLFLALVDDGAGSFSAGGGVNGQQFREEQMPIDPLFGGPQHFAAMLAVTRFNTEKNYRDYLGRLAGLDTLVNQTIHQLRLGMQSGWIRPKPVVERVIGQVKAMADRKPQDHALYSPFTKIPDALPKATNKALQDEARDLLATSVLPAYKRFHAFLKDEYLPAARSTIGATDLPGGKDYYAYSIRRHTTTTMTADEIHAIGLREADRLRKEMQAVMKEVGFKGSIAKFGEKLRNDPKQIYKTGEETLRAHRALAKKLDPLMAKAFGKLPRAPYGVEPMPEAAALSGGAPYYNSPTADGTRGGAFFINTHRPELEPAFTMASLVAHEAVPGHHLQSALAMELKGLPAFRQNAYYTAYGEGWALYAEGLAGELGIYDTPEQRFGALSNEMWRAVRLVVDTGMHAKGWTRQQAIDFFAANAAEQPARIEAEIDRYIAWPGQALGYMMGQLKIKELRAEAEAELGEKFDLRAFHDEVLGAGSMPLWVLEQRMDAWVARQRGG